MNIVKHILVYSLVTIILAESVGIKVIRDTCMPCQNKSVAVQLMYARYESDCSDGCHIDENQISTKIGCCIDSGCAHQKHDHEKDVQILHKYPEFFKNKPINTLKLAPVVTTCFANQIDNRIFLQQRLPHFYFCKKEPVPPDEDVQSLLCSYLI
ncbi:MAG: hypothetical protein MI922_13590 [Bacteroidales bacterium]|nr:hypothetical protein [Bacteroidales bacterium]